MSESVCFLLGLLLFVPGAIMWQVASPALLGSSQALVGAGILFMAAGSFLAIRDWRRGNRRRP